MSSFIDDVKGAVSRVKPMRRDKSDDVNESIFNRFLDFSRNIRKRPAPVQLGVGALAGMITGYIFTKGSKVTAAFIGTGLLAFQVLKQVIYNLLQLFIYDAN
ncbi:hypothetical protein AB6A40_001075 [Gnathostoma spinigerum]|uniref:Uncharacterized protein n=1 Tax=Gnathostoma spinigerum TaxID=75299 RepID=A0ABD6EAB2_9BILA